MYPVVGVQRKDVIPPGHSDSVIASRGQTLRGLPEETMPARAQGFQNGQTVGLSGSVIHQDDFIRHISNAFHTGDRF